MDSPLDVVDAGPEAAAFRADVLAGLAASPRHLPCKYFYDEEGSRLFERICELETYYPTRVELAILEDHAADMTAPLGERAVLLEYGCGALMKVRILLDAMAAPAVFVPIDISGEHLRAAAEELRAAYPALEVRPVVADFTQELELPADVLKRDGARVAFFPGSTIGNFEPVSAHAFLAGVARTLGSGGWLLIGVDMVKDVDVLVRAYDDPEGVTAAFNKNVLTRMKNELGAELDLDGFRHKAVWNEAQSRIEMHLESVGPQTIELAGRTFRFADGETIHTENSHKYTAEGFRGLAEQGGFKPICMWTDPKAWFSVQLLRVR